MTMRLKDKTAIVTGVGLKGHGIGTGICKVLAREGAKVATFDVVEQNAIDSAEDVKALGRDSLAYKVDVVNYAELEKAVRDVIAKWGKLDIMCNNAGISHERCPVNTWETSEAEFDRLVAINCKGVWNGCRAAAPHMVSRRYGKIINTSSMVARDSFPGGAIYTATKYFVNGLTSAMAREIGKYNINVNAVAPGIVETSIWDRLNMCYGELMGKDPKEVFKSFTDTIPLGRPQTPEDVGNVVAFLASDEAKEITGQMYAVCGGKTPI